MSELYILDADGAPQPEPSIVAWARWFEDADRRTIAKDEIAGLLVSTIFLGIDHNWSGVGPPILWETMVFAPLAESEPDPIIGGEVARRFCDDRLQWRYSSADAAIAGHAKIVAELVAHGRLPDDEDGPP